MTSDPIVIGKSGALHGVNSEDAEGGKGWIRENDAPFPCSCQLIAQPDHHRARQSDDVTETEPCWLQPYLKHNGLPHEKSLNAHSHSSSRLGTMTTMVSEGLNISAAYSVTGREELFQVFTVDIRKT